MKTLNLYSFSLPFAFLPLMDFSFGQIPQYLTGLEFRAFISELITQVFTGIADAAIVAFFQTALAG